MADPYEDFDVSPCPACGNPIDYCQGHGLIGDPIGARTLVDHDKGKHDKCHPLSDCKLEDTFG